MYTFDVLYNYYIGKPIGRRRVLLLSGRYIDEVSAASRRTDELIDDVKFFRLPYRFFRHAAFLGRRVRCDSSRLLSIEKMDRRITNFLG